MNLLTETIEAITESGHTPDQIVFIGSEQSGHQCSWDEYRILADQAYDNSYVAQKVAKDLIIVFSDGTRMFRAEYDGSEWWDYVRVFAVPKSAVPIRKLFTNHVGWDTLFDINNEVPK